MGFFSGKCPQCGGKVRRDASFCPHCGEAAPRSILVCPACSKEIRAGGKFCPKCGAPVQSTDEEPVPVDELNRWRPSPNEFARRIEAADLRGTLRRGIVVEPGTSALVFQGGALAGIVTQGTYDLNRPLEGVDLATPATAILIREGDVTLSILCGDLRTREDVLVEAAIEIVVRLSDQQAFYTNLMHGRKSVSNEVLSDLVWSESANVVQARVKQATTDQLEGNLELKAALEADLRANVTQSLARSGLEMVSLRLVGFAAEGFDEIRQARAETFLKEQKIDDTQRRAALNQRLRETLTRDRLDKFTSEKDFEDFVRQTEHELGIKGVVRQAEMEELKRTYVEKKEDGEIARRHLLEKLDLEHRLDIVRQEQTLDGEQLRHRIERECREVDARQEAEWKQVQQELQIRKARGAVEVEEEKSKLDIVKEKARLGMELRKQKIALDHDEESQRLAREQEAKDREAKRELEKIQTLSEVEQARLAADLKKTEIMSDMSEDQILALMAKDSPHVAAAIAERAKAQAQVGASAEVKALYEKILAGKETEADRMERVMGRAMESVERVAGAGAAREREQKEEVKEVTNQSMDRMADVATAKAGASVVADDSKASPSAPMIMCPTCHRQGPVGSKFCDNCGHRFFE